MISDADTHEKIVKSNNITRRGDLCQRAAYRYSTKTGISYGELLRSVSPVENALLLPLRQAEDARADAEVIDAITQCIQDGINTKMDMAAAAAKQSGISKRAVKEAIEKYTDTDPAAQPRSSRRTRPPPVCGYAMPARSRRSQRQR